MHILRPFADIYFLQTSVYYLHVLSNYVNMHISSVYLSNICAHIVAAPLQGLQLVSLPKSKMVKLFKQIITLTRNMAATQAIAIIIAHTEGGYGSRYENHFVSVLFLFIDIRANPE